MTRESIDQLARRLFESMPQSIRGMRDDVEKNFRSVLASGLSRMDLVTREEFEVQQAVLSRTRSKLEALEGRLAALEQPAEAASKKPAKKAVSKEASARKKPGAKKPGKKKAKKKTAKKK